MKVKLVILFFVILIIGLIQINFWISKDNNNYGINLQNIEALSDLEDGNSYPCVVDGFLCVTKDSKGNSIFWPGLDIEE